MPLKTCKHSWFEPRRAMRTNLHVVIGDWVRHFEQFSITSLKFGFSVLVYCRGQSDNSLLSLECLTQAAHFLDLCYNSARLQIMNNIHFHSSIMCSYPVFIRLQPRVSCQLNWTEKKLYLIQLTLWAQLTVKMLLFSINLFLEDITRVCWVKTLNLDTFATPAAQIKLSSSCHSLTWLSAF